MSSHLNFWQVDAFTNSPFKGNPAAIFFLDKELPDRLMQDIAAEMNLSETAFVLFREGDLPLLRWFSPAMEIDLCGHATLASAHIYMTEINPDCSEVIFDAKFVEPLRVRRVDAGYSMDFPSRPGREIALSEVPESLLDTLSTEARPRSAYKSRDLMLVYDDERDILRLDPALDVLRQYKDFVIVTAKSDKPGCDFISRFFCADAGVIEDPVTGSAHCTLAPYWANRLGKEELRAYQASKRGGYLVLKVEGERVLITGEVVTVLDGTMRV